MKDEEMAEEYADNVSGLELTCSLLSAKDKSHAYRLGRYDGFLFERNTILLNENERLKKENAELKADYEVLSCSVGDFGELQDKLEGEQRKNNELSDNLTKAKDIIKNLLEIEYPSSSLEECKKAIEQAEQFIKEIKEK